MTIPAVSKVVTVFGKEKVFKTPEIKRDIRLPHSISFIFSTQDSEFQISIYNRPDVFEKWKAITKLSSGYQYAEPEGSQYGDPLRNFPKSSYGLEVNGHFNNSNTFVFEIISPIATAAKVDACLKDQGINVLGNRGATANDLEKEPVPDVLAEADVEGALNGLRELVEALPETLGSQIKKWVPTIFE